MFKYYGDADLDKMDLPEYDRALQVAIASGMPKNIIDAIWKPRRDREYLTMMMPNKDK